MFPLIDVKDLDQAKRIIRNQQSQIDSMQARIDELMLEYCPHRMTKSQKENWARHQQSVKE